MAEVLDMREFYMRKAWEPSKVAKAMREQLADVDYDTIVGTGLSGAIIVPMLAQRLRKHALIVRKPRDGSHSAQSVEGKLGKRWLFVDDFVSTGATSRRVHDAIHDTAFENAHDTEFVGTFSYESGRYIAAADSPKWYLP